MLNMTELQKNLPKIKATKIVRTRSGEVAHKYAQLDYTNFLFFNSENLLLYKHLYQFINFNDFAFFFGSFFNFHSSTFN